MDLEMTLRRDPTGQDVRIGMLECWDSGIMGSGLPTGLEAYWLEAGSKCHRLGESNGRDV